jgi:DNA-binding NtrC family response regulator
VAPEQAPTDCASPRATVVLVVEDEVLVRIAVADYLRERGLKVYEANGAGEAIELLSHYENEIDVLFSDVKLPGAMDGIDLAAWIRAHRPGLPCILTSGETGVAERASQSTFFVSKPYDLNAVLILLQSAVGKRGATESPSD